MVQGSDCRIRGNGAPAETVKAMLCPGTLHKFASQLHWTKPTRDASAVLAPRRTQLRVVPESDYSVGPVTSLKKKIKTLSFEFKRRPRARSGTFQLESFLEMGECLISAHCESKRGKNQAGIINH